MIAIFFLIQMIHTGLFWKCGRIHTRLPQAQPTIRARYIRFLPVVWHNNIAMKVELYGCQGTVVLFLLSLLLLFLFRNSATAICHKRLIYYKQCNNDKLHFDKHVSTVLFCFILF